MGEGPRGAGASTVSGGQLWNLEAALLSLAAERQASVLALLGVFTRLRRLTAQLPHLSDGDAAYMSKLQ